MVRTRRKKVQSYDESKSGSKKTRKTSAAVAEPSTSEQKQSPTKPNAELNGQPKLNVSHQGEDFLLYFFEHATNIKAEMELCRERGVPGVIEGDTRDIMRTFLTKPEERLRNPLRFLTFEFGIDQAHLLTLHQYPEFQSQPGLVKYKRLLAANGFSESTIQLSDRNTAYDWIWFDMRSRGGDDVELATDDIPKLILKRYNEGRIELRKIERENRGKLITRRQLTFKICWFITNFTEIVKQYLEDHGIDEYNEDKDHVQIFNRWWSEEMKPLRKKWKFQQGWELVNEQTLVEHLKQPVLTYQRFKQHPKTREMMLEFLNVSGSLQMTDQQEDIFLNKFYQLCVFSLPHIYKPKFNFLFPLSREEAELPSLDGLNLDEILSEQPPSEQESLPTQSNDVSTSETSQNALSRTNSNNTPEPAAFEVVGMKSRDCGEPIDPEIQMFAGGSQQFNFLPLPTVRLERISNQDRKEISPATSSSYFAITDSNEITINVTETDYDFLPSPIVLYEQLAPQEPEVNTNATSSSFSLPKSPENSPPVFLHSTPQTPKLREPLFHTPNQKIINVSDVSPSGLTDDSSSMFANSLQLTVLDKNPFANMPPPYEPSPIVIPRTPSPEVNITEPRSNLVKFCLRKQMRKRSGTIVTPLKTDSKVLKLPETPTTSTSLTPRRLSPRRLSPRLHLKNQQIQKASTKKINAPDPTISDHQYNKTESTVDERSPPLSTTKFQRIVLRLKQ